MNRSVKWLASLGALVLIAGVVVVNANAHIGASHRPFETEGPDLLTAEIDDDQVVYCFDQEVTDVSDEAGFHLRGYNSVTEATSDSADLAEEEECVEVEFDDTDRDISEFTVGSIDEDTVEDRSDESNVESAVTLTGSDATEEEGRTDAPNLEEFEADDDDETITYTFDEDVDCTAVDEADFGFYTEDGDQFDAGTEEECDDNEVTIGFAADPVDDAERAYVETAGVTGEDPSAAPVGFESEGEETDAPDLDSAERSDDDEVTFFFDEDVEGADETLFHVYAEDGTEYDTASCDESDEEVECSFDDIEDAEDTEIVLAGVGDAAVTDDAATDDSTVGDAALGESGVAPGFTDGPDLEMCTIDEDDDLATFTFDEQIDEDSATDTAFDIFDEEGDSDDATDIDDSEEDEGTITLEFDEDTLEDAVGCHVDEGAVDDFLGNAAPPASVGIGSPSPTPTTTVITSTITPDEPQTITVSSRISIGFNRPVFSGKVNSERRGCESSRRVVLKKKRKGRDRPVGDDVTNNKGGWKVREGGANRKYFAVAQRKVFTAPNGDTIICQRAASPTERV